MRKLIISMSLVLVMFTAAYGYYISSVTTTGIAATITDTIGPFKANDFGQLWLNEYLDLESSTTITQTITVMDANKRDISNATTIASAITADADFRMLLRNVDTTVVTVPLFYLKRVTTVTGDSVTCKLYISGW